MDSYPYHMIKWDPQPTVGGSWARVHAEGDMVPSRHFPFFFLFLFDFDRLTLVSDIDGYSFSLSLLRNLVALECTVPLNLTEFSKRVVVSLLQRYDFPEWSRRRLVQEGSGLSDSTTQKPGGQPWWC